MSWFFLFVAGLCEVAWAVGLKQVQISAQPLNIAGTILAILMSMACLSMAMKNIPLGTAYAIWTGIGALGTVAVGIACYNEPVSAARLFCAAMVFAGLIGLKITAH